jgi:hypothetical protein
MIMVTISTTLAEYLFDVVITPPGGQWEVLTRSGGSRQITWARRIASDGDRPRAEPRAATRRVNGDGWEWDDPFGEFDDRLAPVGPIGPGPSGGGGPAMRYTRVLDPSTDEPGTWTVRVRNRDQDNQQFLITVEHPETVQPL